MTNYISELKAKMAAYSGVCFIQEEDEYRLRTKTHQAAAGAGYTLWRWTYSDGLVPVSPEIVESLKTSGLDARGVALRLQEWANIKDPVGNERAPGLLTTVKAWELGPAVILACDFFTLANRLPTLPLATRLIKDITDVQQSLPVDKPEQICQLIICDMEKPGLPCTMQKLSLELPDRKEMASILDPFIDGADETAAVHATENRDRILNALAGLPAYQAGNALAEARSRTGVLDPDIIRSYKKEMVAAKGITWVEPDPGAGFDKLGGLTPLKKWAKRRAEVMLNEDLRKEYGLGSPKALVCAGYPGCGKSALAQQLAAELGTVFLKADVASTRGKYQGDSESAFRAMLDVCVSVAPAVVLFDEVEKSMAQGNAETDGGTSSRILGTLLSWMQDNTEQIFIYMTANRPELLPPELLRAGRTSGQFWFDLPTETERAAIIDVYVKKYPKAKDIDNAQVLKASDGTTGAEIENAFEEAAIAAFSERRDMLTEDVVAELRKGSKVKDTFEMSDSLKKWRDGAQRANDPEDAAVAESSTNSPDTLVAPRRIARTR